MTNPDTATSPPGPATGALRALWHRLGSPRWFHDIAGAWLPWIGALAALLVGIGVVQGLAFAPPDYQQGDSFRIMYVHVPAAIIAQNCYVLMGVAGVVLLVWRMKLADIAIEAAAPIGAAWCVLALATGSIWGKPTWGAWWVWDARTTSVLVQLFLYIGVIALRAAIGRDAAASRACAVLAIVGTVNIPVIKYSVDLWLTMHQPSSFKLTGAPTMPASMYVPLLFTVLGFYLTFVATLLMQMRVIVLEREQRTRWVQALVARHR